MNADNFVLVCPSSIERDVNGTATLVGNQCVDCGETYFPAASGCTRCTSTHLNRFNFGRHGTLWTWTIQSFLPKAPYNSGEIEADFKPYGVGYIEMPSGIKIESRLSVADADKLKIGASMAMSLETYGKTSEGASLVTFVFSPAESDIKGVGNE
ncbi:DNA-binding protein [Burkholderia sp. FL-7-2-10-S1-D7]|uniref:Zn-ribbon domain-containing OB-fold protein n=1 Tax=Burkholderia sp. FL-7-2-10-S1-D7 TaxID=1637866 RepID=UPI0007522D79|nr:OB-fold domain-containing protein [Burkholderia sp. FL-7-2-10-S1-D7]KVF79341.1 DNA-binding protein [Burkholderia sp. FL-7-2-10-S1-D7]